MILLLNPVGHTAHGRRSFQIHGDSARRPGLASSGCIVLLLISTPMKPKRRHPNGASSSAPLMEPPRF
jgi:hypothetical protein